MKRLFQYSALALAASFVFTGCRAAGRAAHSGHSEATLFDGMGNHHRTVTTASPQAQRYFDQGLIWAFAFNHDEAIRSFEKAAELDPQCAMAWWGVALCHGPHINNPAMTPDRSEAAWQALLQAVALKQHANPAEQALIDALSKRYAWPVPQDRKPLDQAYADAMREVWTAHKTDPDIGVLFAEAMMDLQPWDLWDKSGAPKGKTQEIIAVLDKVLGSNPNHPGALHLTIHALEASPHPERAIVAADRLRNAVPASGHLVHMPSHIDVLTGRWALASEQNENAIKADRAYRSIRPRIGFYHIYMAHNHHMLTFASMMEGRWETAIRAARDVVNGVPEDYARDQATLIDPWMSAPYDVLKRFGKWNELLAEPPPPSIWPVTTAMWRFNRGLALAAMKQIDEAKQEREAFRKAVGNVPEKAMMFINPAHRILSVAEHMLNGEIAYAEGDGERAVKELTEAVTLEDQLTYMEPPEWIQPVRHTLGAVLLSAGRYEEAEKVYREDLEKWPENGWSLQGLAKCLHARGATAEAQEYEQRFRKAWSRADTKIGSSCLCVPST